MSRHYFHGVGEQTEAATESTFYHPCLLLYALPPSLTPRPALLAIKSILSEEEDGGRSYLNNFCE